MYKVSRKFGKIYSKNRKYTNMCYIEVVEETYKLASTIHIHSVKTRYIIVIHSRESCVLCL